MPVGLRLARLLLRTARRARAPNHSRPAQRCRLPIRLRAAERVLHQAMSRRERESRSPFNFPVGGKLTPLAIPSDIVVPAPPQPLECPWDEDYDDSNEYNDLIPH